jgi:hypothetical protein
MEKNTMSIIKSATYNYRKPSVSRTIKQFILLVESFGVSTETGFTNRELTTDDDVISQLEDIRYFINKIKLELEN